jgi:CBS domain-containing protein
MRAKDIMSSPAYTVAQTASVESAAQLITAKAVTALPVLDDAGRLAGMVSESDLLWHRVPADPTAHLRRLPEPDPEQRPGLVVEVMTPYPVTTRPDADVAEVAQMMLEHDVRSLPVSPLDGDRRRRDRPDHRRVRRRDRTGHRRRARPYGARCGRRRGEPAAGGGRMTIYRGSGRRRSNPASSTSTLCAHNGPSKPMQGEARCPADDGAGRLSATLRWTILSIHTMTSSSGST